METKCPGILLTSDYLGSASAETERNGNEFWNLVAMTIVWSRSLTGAEAAADVGSLFKFSGGEGESLAADTGFIGLMLKRGSKNKFLELFDL